MYTDQLAGCTTCRVDSALPARVPCVIVSGTVHTAILLAAAGLATGLPAVAATGVDEAFGAALERRDVAGAVALLDKGADPNTRLIHGKTVLMAAAKAGARDLASRLLERGADVNARNDNGGTALMYAAIPGHVETITLLIDHGADINALGHFNWTALMVAASKGHGESVRLLLERGADPDIQPECGVRS